MELCDEASRTARGSYARRRIGSDPDPLKSPSASPGRATHRLAVAASGWHASPTRPRSQPMSTTAPVITGVDFVTVSATDFSASVQFYGEVLGLPLSARYGSRDGAEFETGSLTLAVIRSEDMGMTFATNTHPIAFHVDDVEAARAALESRGVEF